MATTHSTITDPNIHETKGYQAAEAGTVKMATGSGNSTFNRPLDLVYTFDESPSGTESSTVTGLDDYRTLIFVLEEWPGNTGLYLQFQFYNGSTWRTSGYKNNITDQNSDSLNSNTTGAICALFDSSTNSRGFAISTISNFNASGDYTSVSSKYTSRNYIQSGTSLVPTSREPGSAYGYYPTAEAHSGVRLHWTSSTSLGSTIKGTLWGIRG